MKAKILAYALPALILTLFHLAEAQQPKVYHVGVIFHGGEWNPMINGLRDGLRELGLKNFTLEVRNTKGNVKAVDEAARSLERDHVDLLYTVAFFRYTPKAFARSAKDIANETFD